jgi:hypothetical protein
MPALSALLDWELALVIAVDEALLWDQAPPPCVCILPEKEERE